MAPVFDTEHAYAILAGYEVTSVGPRRCIAAAVLAGNSDSPLIQGADADEPRVVADGAAILDVENATTRIELPTSRSLPTTQCGNDTTPPGVTPAPVTDCARAGRVSAAVKAKATTAAVSFKDRR
jgi:hypothetical protein